MHVGNILIVDRNVRVVDVDGSFEEVSIETALAIYEWVPRHRMRLLDELRLQQEAARKKERKHEQEQKGG